QEGPESSDGSESAVSPDDPAEDEGGSPAGEPLPDEEADESEGTGDRGDTDLGDDSAESDDLGGEEAGESGEPKDYGTPSQVAEQVDDILGHAASSDVPKVARPEDTHADRAAINTAVQQGKYFDSPSTEISGVFERREGYVGGAWSTDFNGSRYEEHVGLKVDLTVPEPLVAEALLRMRTTFDNNARRKDTNHLKSGRVNPRTLGKRAWSGDERLFRKRTLPGRKSYFVLVGVDVSGSTAGPNIALLKKSAAIQAELLHRAGIPFAVAAHTASAEDNSRN